jgi:hypothetical protein
MLTFDEYLKTLNPKINFLALPDIAKNELIEFYEFLVFKYRQKPKSQLDEKRVILSTIFQEADGKLPSEYKFNREEIHER